MRWFAKILAVAILLIVVFAALVFLSSNDAQHTLMFYESSIINGEVGVFVLVALVLGVVVGFLAFLPAVSLLRRQNKKMQKRLADKQAQLEAMSG